MQLVISNRTLGVQLALENHAAAIALGIFDGEKFPLGKKVKKSSWKNLHGEASQLTVLDDVSSKSVTASQNRQRSAHARH